MGVLLAASKPEVLLARGHAVVVELAFAAACLDRTHNITEKGNYCGRRQRFETRMGTIATTIVYMYSPIIGRTLCAAFSPFSFHPQRLSHTEQTAQSLDGWGDKTHGSSAEVKVVNVPMNARKNEVYYNTAVIATSPFTTLSTYKYVVSCLHVNVWKYTEINCTLWWSVSRKAKRFCPLSSRDSSDHQSLLYVRRDGSKES